jgi:hypothetical protein
LDAVCDWSSCDTLSCDEGFFFFFGQWQQKKITKGGIAGGIRYNQLMLNGENDPEENQRDMDVESDQERAGAIVVLELPERRHSSASQRTIRDERLRSSWMRQRVVGRNVLLHDEFPLDEEEDDNDNVDTHEEPKHPFVGRIGTIATIKSTPMNSLSSSQVWSRHEEGTELVFTAVGTSRFRVLSCVQQDPSLADYKIFKVEEWKDEPLALPPIQRPLALPPSLLQEQRTDDDPIRNLKYHQNQARPRSNNYYYYYVIQST